jgi:translation initiation factor IF-1
MAKSSPLLKFEGLVEEALPGLLFRVKAEVGGGAKTVLAHLAGRLKINHIRVIPGDRVLVEMSDPNDERGRIVRRL